MKQRGFTLMETLVSLGLMLAVGLGVAQMIRGAGDSASKSVKQAKQNGELRNTMDTMQSSISSADRPLLKVTLKTGSNGVKTPEGNELVYTRTEDRRSSSSDTGGVSYLVERVYFDDSNGDGTGDVILQRKSFSSDAARSSAITSQALDTPAAVGSGWSNAPKKLLLSKAQIPTDKSLFDYSAKAGVPATVTDGQIDTMSLVDINLQRDEDGSGNDFKPASLTSTVYLRKIGSNNTKGGAIGC